MTTELLAALRMHDATVETIDASDPARLREAVLRAVDFRGDVTIERVDGSVVEGFAFDACVDPVEAACIRILPADGSPRQCVPLAGIRTLAFSGKDAASGKSWENWLRRYAERKLAGQSASIESDPL
jgi:hypothetical protein